MKRGERKRGFNQFRKQVRDKKGTARQVANCLSCKFYTKEEECNNPNVTEFDMVYEDHRTFCTFWKGFEYDNGRRKDDDLW
jgi:hypothetical protein